MDPLWIAVAFVLGFAARQVGLPPLVGFLGAGFVLHGFGAESGQTIQEIADLGDAEILIFGMGRVGRGAYEAVRERFGDAVLGIDFDAAEVARLKAAGCNVVRGDAKDLAFWQRIDPSRIRLVMFVMPSHAANLAASTLLSEIGYTGRIAAVAGFDDEVAELERAGVHAAFNSYREAGAGFANDVCSRLGDLTPDSTT